MMKFLPDAPESTPEVLLEASAVPTIRGYRNPYELVASTYSAVPANTLGGALVFKLDGSTRVFAGTATKLYEASGSSFGNDVSRAGSYSVGTNKWRFAQVGNTTIACNKAVQLQYSASGAFADIANSWKANCIETVGPFVVVANLDDTGTGLTTGYGDQSNRWACSQSFNATGTWQPSVATRATSGLLVATPGSITGLRRLSANIVAYKERSIYLGTLTDGNDTIRWDVVADDVGCATQDAVVAVGSVHYFVGDNDFYVFDGTRPVPIGDGIKEWFFARLNKTYAYTIESLHDRSNNNVYWFYPSGSNTTPDSVVVYNYKTQRWGQYTQSVRNTLQAVTGTITYDSLGSLFSTYNDLPDIGYDSPFWVASSPVLAAIGTDNILYTLTGTTGASSLKTGWIGDEASVSTCTRVRPKFRTVPTTATMVHNTRMWLGQTATAGSSVSINNDRFDTLKSARYHQFSMTFDGSMEIESIGPVLVPAGAE